MTTPEQAEQAAMLAIPYDFRRQARAALARIMSGFPGWVWQDEQRHVADNGVLTAWVVQNDPHEPTRWAVVVQNNYFTYATMSRALTPAMQARALWGDEARALRDAIYEQYRMVDAPTPAEQQRTGALQYTVPLLRLQQGR